MPDNAKTYVAGECKWNYDLTTATIGAKCLLLNAGGTACIGSLRPSDVKEGFFKAWAPLPKRDKSVEEALGIRI